MGSSLIMSKYTALSTCSRSGKNPYPMWGGGVTGSGPMAHRGTTCFLLPLRTQRPALPPPISASWQGMGWEGTLPWRREQSTIPLPASGEPGAGRGWGRGLLLPSGSQLLLGLSFTISSSPSLPFTSRYCICCKNLIFFPRQP